VARVCASAASCTATSALLTAPVPVLFDPLTNVFRGALSKRGSLASRQLAQLQQRVAIVPAKK
jgi:hypothetical protein